MRQGQFAKNFIRYKPILTSWMGSDTSHSYLSLFPHDLSVLGKNGIHGVECIITAALISIITQGLSYVRHLGALFLTPKSHIALVG